VVLDCPPVLDNVESALLGAVADGVVVVVEAKRWKHHVVNHGLQSLAQQKVNVLGTVLNKRRFDLPKVVYTTIVSRGDPAAMNFLVDRIIGGGAARSTHRDRR